MTKLKLSQLPDNVEVSAEGSNARYTVAELKREITELGEPHHLTPNWYTIKEATWTPAAESVLERIIDDAYDDMYEGWDDRANDCVTEEAINKLQPILNDIFDSAREYWEYDKPVEIDIFPHEAGDPT